MLQHYSSRTRASGQPLKSFDGKVIATIVGDTLHKVVKGSRHMLRQPKGWAVDAGAIQQAQAAGVRWIEIFDKESKITYFVTLEKFLRYAISLNRGFGPQLVLCLDYWQVRKPGEPKQLDLL